MGAVDEVWTTPHRATPVDAVVALPGSKSLTARALVLAALADGPSRLVRPLTPRRRAWWAMGRVGPLTDRVVERRGSPA